MSLTMQMLLAATAPAMFIGGFAGCFVAPYFVEPLDSNVELCGLQALGRTMRGGIVGVGFGFVIGLPLAWWMPTPEERPKQQKSSDP